MADTSKRTLILIGIEGPVFGDVHDTRKVFWHPHATEPAWRLLVKRAVVEFLEKNAQEEWRWDASTARVEVFRNQDDFTRVLGQTRYDRLIVYSHGYAEGLMATLDKPGGRIGAYALAKAIAESGVRAALLLGCNSKELAETTARIAEGYVRIGGIEPLRQDHVDSRKRRLDILNPIIWGYGGQKP
jgi:hypothetical protein